jgi:hypothetical protein
MMLFSADAHPKRVVCRVANDANEHRYKMLRAVPSPSHLHHPENRRRADAVCSSVCVESRILGGYYSDVPNCPLMSLVT